jgi:hypothetical protein
MKKFNLIVAPILCAASIVLMAGVGIAANRAGLVSQTESRTTVEPAKTKVTVTVTVTGDQFEVAQQVRKMLAAMEGQIAVDAQ